MNATTVIFGKKSVILFYMTSSFGNIYDSMPINLAITFE